jgi:hypothetical protein
VFRQGDQLVGLPDPCQRRKTYRLFVGSPGFLSPFVVLTRSILSSNCVGATPDGKDFEAFIGPEKAKEFKALFASWALAIYRSSYLRPIPLRASLTLPTAEKDWPLYTLEQPTPSSSTSSGSNLEQESGDETDGNDETGSEEIITDAILRRPDLPPATVAVIPPSTAGDPPLQPAAIPPAMLAETNADGHSCSDLLSSDVHPASSTAVPVDAVLLPEHQDVLDPKVSGHLDHRVSSGGADRVTPSNLPANARESVWMKARGTLKYFRGVYQMDGLSDLIYHWYQLEEALDFPETVSHLIIGVTRTHTDAPEDPT